MSSVSKQENDGRKVGRRPCNWTQPDFKLSNVASVNHGWMDGCFCDSIIQMTDESAADLATGGAVTSEDAQIQRLNPLHSRESNHLQVRHCELLSLPSLQIISMESAAYASIPHPPSFFYQPPRASFCVMIRWRSSSASPPSSPYPTTLPSLIHLARMIPIYHRSWNHASISESARSEDFWPEGQDSILQIRHAFPFSVLLTVFQDLHSCILFPSEIHHTSPGSEELVWAITTDLPARTDLDRGRILRRAMG